MIVTEYLNDGTLIKHYSDANMLMLQVETEIKYAEAIDIVPCRYTYIETDEPIEDTKEEEKEENTVLNDNVVNKTV